MSTTPWFECSEGNYPVRSGLYQIKGSSRIWWSFWDDDACEWGQISSTQEGAVNWRNTASGAQSKTWRGILKDET